MLRPPQNSATGAQIFQTRAAAISSGRGTHYIVNLSSGVTSKWLVEIQCSGSICTPDSYDATLVPTETAISNYVSFYKENNGRSIEVSNGTGFPANAYDGIRYPQLSANVGVYIGQSGVGFLSDFRNLIGSIGSFLTFNVNSIPMTIRVHYQDGSTALYVFENTTKLGYA